MNRRRIYFAYAPQPGCFYDREIRFRAWWLSGGKSIRVYQRAATAYFIRTQEYKIIGWSRTWWLPTSCSCDGNAPCRGNYQSDRAKWRPRCEIIPMILYSCVPKWNERRGPWVNPDALPCHWAIRREKRDLTVVKTPRLRCIAKYIRRYSWQGYCHCNSFLAYAENHLPMRPAVKGSGIFSSKGVATVPHFL